MRSKVLASLVPLLLAATSSIVHAAQSSGVSALAVAPSGNALLAGAASTIYRSTDRGASWSRVWSSDDVFVASLAFDPFSSDAFAATTAGLFRSADGGSTWSDTDLLGGTMPGKIVFDPVQKSTLYVASADGLYVTNDRGHSWREISPNRRHFAIRSLAVRTKPFTLYVVNEEGLFSSTDRGASWSSLTGERDDLNAVEFEPPATLHVAANGSHYLRSDDGGKTWKSPAREWPHFSDFFVVGSSVYARSDAAIWRSADRGATWKKWKADDELPLRALVADPQKKGVVWAPALHDGVFISADDGATWTLRRLERTATNH